MCHRGTVAGGRAVTGGPQEKTQVSSRPAAEARSDTGAGAGAMRLGNPNSIESARGAQPETEREKKKRELSPRKKKRELNVDLKIDGHVSTTDRSPG